MHRWLLRTGIALLALFAVLAALWGTSRLLGASAGQRQALALFQDMPASEGGNAFPALWLLQWDVPEAEQAAIVAADAERFGALPSLGDPARKAALGAFRSVAADRYEDLEASLPVEPASCGMRETGCLERVLAERDAHAARLERSARLVDRVEAVFDHDHYRNLLPLALDMPFPRLPLMQLARTRHALQFVDGEVDVALAGTCRALGGWRRLTGDSDSLLVAMYAAAGIEGHANLLADMLAQVPTDHPLPAACDVALAPPQAGEFGLCRAMRGEWEFGRSALDMVDAGEGGTGRLVQWLALDRGATDALAAWNMSWPCGEEAARALEHDVPMQPPSGDGRPWRFECVANAIGCILMESVGPPYADYGRRMQDARARIQLLRTLEWLRGRAAAGGLRGAGELLAQLPDGLGGTTRAVDIDPESARLRMELFSARPDAHWSVPLPPALRTQGEGAGGR